MLLVGGLPSEEQNFLTNLFELPIWAQALQVSLPYLATSFIFEIHEKPVSSSPGGKDWLLEYPFVM